ncbi:tRNA pseudouridine synthase B [Paenibacillus baekrokdamisoli]|uniref:tRNA pseudouridine synthase B n=1 Tax=Paenibacillus baekrokdamisoli TaxID=1712516 RepID=A0A3G9IR15_9BACL|nr:tRNA pseudouridine(55) synthase TruB [Paenibacillus baekrokdamisoli]MBB3069820.1 tRNA pseudouridine55 synthase [Paenibacillus baekrokdamisoli]BBH20826.1 tRNA pseudouridine synthase B [Paenibacillus baekrokdamisoli]
MDGILAVWKPAGWTSHDVVAKVRGLLRTKRIGHAGTLDPQVTGVLPLCIGRATRVVEYVQEKPKAYEAVLQFGLATDTEDLTGTVVSQVDEVVISEADIRRILTAFTGEIDQVPPMYSAVQVGGKRLYELAREGQVIERQARKVTIYELELLALDLDKPHPTIRFSVQCSKGTYIRTLCVDIGKALGVPAVMAELKRTMSAGFTEEQCLTMEEIEQLQASGELESKLLPADAALEHFPRCTVNSETAQHAFQGKRVPLPSIADLALSGDNKQLIRLYREDGLFIGLFEREADTELLKAVKVFTPA